MAKFLDESGVSVLWGKVKERIASDIADVVDGAPEALDTLKEISDWIANDESGSSALVARVEGLESNALSAGDGIVIEADNKITYNPDILSTVDYVDGSISDTLSYIDQEIRSEHAGRVAGDNLKVDKEITGTNGKAQIFNEADGGGAHFIHTDGSEAFVGVNDGGLDGLMAQIYADEKVNGNWVGSRINVYNDKIYYTNRADVENGVAKNDASHEIATKGDLEGLGGGADVEALSAAEIAEICV